MPASKLAIAIYASIKACPCYRRREVNSIEFFVLFYATFPKAFGEAKKNVLLNI